jgi:hypothetical protein
MRMHRDVLATALANKLARVAWSVLADRRGHKAAGFSKGGKVVKG